MPVNLEVAVGFEFPRANKVGETLTGGKRLPRFVCAHDIHPQARKRTGFQRAYLAADSRAPDLCLERSGEAHFEPEFLDIGGLPCVRQSRRSFRPGFPE